MLIVDPVEQIPPILLGQNLGGANAVFAGKSGQKLTFNTIDEGTGINIVLAANVLTISVDESDLSYPTTFAALTDTDMTGVADKDLIEYQSGTGEWQPRSTREIKRNNASGTTVTDNSTVTIVTLDKTETQAAVIHYCAYRKSDSDTEAVKQGYLNCMYRTDSDDWVMSELNFHDDINAIGLSWSINSATGAVSYTSTDFTDTGYESNLKFGFISELPI